MATPIRYVHNGDSAGDNEFNSYVLCLNLNKGLFNTCLDTHHLVRLSLLPWLVMSGKMEGSYLDPHVSTYSFKLLFHMFSYLFAFHM